MRGTRVKALKRAFLFRYGRAPLKCDWKKVVRRGSSIWEGWESQRSEWRIWKKLTRGMKIRVVEIQ